MKLIFAQLEFYSVCTQIHHTEETRGKTPLGCKEADFEGKKTNQQIQKKKKKCFARFQQGQPLEVLLDKTQLY